jgi:hypothetical protein
MITSAGSVQAGSSSEGSAGASRIGEAAEVRKQTPLLNEPLVLHSSGIIVPAARATDRRDIDKMTTYAVIMGRGMACGASWRGAYDRVSDWLVTTFSGTEGAMLAMIFVEGMRYHAEQQSKGLSPDNCSAVRATFHQMPWP